MLSIPTHICRETKTACFFLLMNTELGSGLAPEAEGELVLGWESFPPPGLSVLICKMAFLALTTP